MDYDSYVILFSFFFTAILLIYFFATSVGRDFLSILDYVAISIILVSIVPFLYNILILIVGNDMKKKAKSRLVFISILLFVVVSMWFFAYFLHAAGTFEIATEQRYIPIE